MSYATPIQFVGRFGLREVAQMLTDEEQLLTEQLLRDVLSSVWTGSPSGDEMAAADAALARLTRQLEVASDLMDGYLRRVVKLPLAADFDGAGTLEECCAALTRCGLADDSDNATERMDKTAATWRAWLKDVSDGRVQLVGVSGETPPSSVGIRTGQAKSAFDWGSFGGVR